MPWVTARHPGQAAPLPTAPSTFSRHPNLSAPADRIIRPRGPPPSTYPELLACPTSSCPLDAVQRAVISSQTRVQSPVRLLVRTLWLALSQAQSALNKCSVTQGGKSRSGSSPLASGAFQRSCPRATTAWVPLSERQERPSPATAQ